MSGNGSMTRIYIFVLILNLIFPVLSYTFTAFGGSPEDYEISLDSNSLLIAGINFEDAESHNLTYNGGWVEYVLLNRTMRAQFMDDYQFSIVYDAEDGIGFQKMGVLGKPFDSWFIPVGVGVKSVLSNIWMRQISNATIVTEWNEEFNWSRFVLRDGHQVFVTPFATDGNITKAVFEDAHLNVTIAKSFAEDTSFNFWKFLGWYSSLMIGDQAWGLPSMFAWILRILGAISVFAVVMLTKELIKL
ncbi:hypothetical protein ES702_01968 [subsurface metagenome]